MGLFPKTRSILEKGLMEFRPFGKDLNGENIRDVSGVTVRANVEFLKELVSKAKGRETGEMAVKELIQTLNSRIPDSAYHVTPEFLKNPWNSYSYEFVMYLSEFCVLLTDDPAFPSKLGREKLLSPIIQVLGRPFSIVQIYKLYPYFVEKFTKGALLPEVVSVTNGSAVMRLRLGEKTAKQFGAYRLSCADRICQSTKTTIAETPARMFGLRPAVVEERSCMGNGAEYCEWQFSWERQGEQSFVALGVSLLLSGLMLTILQVYDPALSLTQSLGLSLLPGFLAWTVLTLWADRNAIQQKERIIQEQLGSVEFRHEELREAYLEQEQTAVELRRHVEELTIAYAEIETLNAGLEAKVQERTRELEHLNQDLETANQRLQELDRVKSQFLSHCSHELRTPLTSIKGFTENLLEGLGGDLTSKQLTCLRRVNANADRLTRMIDDLLDLSRIEAGTVDMNWQEVRLLQLATDVTDQFSPLAQSKRQHLEVICQDKHLSVVGDGDRLTQILTNLIHNAMKFTPEGGHIHVLIERGQECTVLIAVRDHGPGIPEDALSKLFDPFFQAHRDREIGTKGLGLGLAIVKRLVDLHDGTIAVESAQGEGTTFRITLPIRRPALHQ